MIRDDFGQDLPPGAVLGSAAEDGSVRGGIDAEGTLAVDDGALRIGCLAQPGWGREALSYGPVALEPNLACAVLVLNGHNASAPHDPPVYGLVRGRLHRLSRALLPSRRPPRLEENLAVGWSEDPGEGSRRPAGPLFFVRQEEGENATLCARICGRVAPLLPRLRDLPLLYVVVLRPESAVYYAAAAIEGAATAHAAADATARGRPDHTGAEAAGDRRAVGDRRGGWRIGSRVQAVRVAEPPSWPTSPPLPDAPAGLVCGRLEAAGSGLRWRAGEDGGGFALTLGEDGITLSAHVGDADTELARERGALAGVFAQVLDDGEEISVLLDGEVRLRRRPAGRPRRRAHRRRPDRRGRRVRGLPARGRLPAALEVPAPGGTSAVPSCCSATASRAPPASSASPGSRATAKGGSCAAAPGRRPNRRRPATAPIPDG